jgi:glycosyltransferase involved in cell wall biosynthesis
MSSDGAVRSLRILAVTNMWPQPGYRRGGFVRQIVDSLQALGHAVDVEVVAESRGKADYVLAAFRLRNRARRGNYDVVHIHFGMTALACRFVGTPRVLSLYGSDINVAWKRRLTRFGWGGTAARIYVSKRLAEQAGDSQADIVPNGVDLALFKPADRDARRVALGFAPLERIVLFGADPRRPEKGYDTFREVCAELGRRGVRTRQMVLTEPDQPIDRVVEKMDAADVLLFTSQRGSEGSPTVVKEAIVMGLPVVSVDVGDVAEMLSGVQPSVVVPLAGDRGTHRPDNGLVGHLATGVATVLLDGRRANGREQRLWLDHLAIAERIVQVLRRAAR